MVEEGSKVNRFKSSGYAVCLSTRPRGGKKAFSGAIGRARSAESIYGTIEGHSSEKGKPNSDPLIYAMPRRRSKNLSDEENANWARAARSNESKRNLRSEINPIFIKNRNKKKKKNRDMKSDQPVFRLQHLENRDDGYTGTGTSSGSGSENRLFCNGRDNGREVGERLTPKKRSATDALLDEVKSDVFKNSSSSSNIEVSSSSSGKDGQSEGNKHAIDKYMRDRPSSRQHLEVVQEGSSEAGSSDVTVSSSSDDDVANEDTRQTKDRDRRRSVCDTRRDKNDRKGKECDDRYPNERKSPNYSSNLSRRQMNDSHKSVNYKNDAYEKDRYAIESRTSDRSIDVSAKDPYNAQKSSPLRKKPGSSRENLLASFARKPPARVSFERSDRSEDDSSSDSDASTTDYYAKAKEDKGPCEAWVSFLKTRFKKLDKRTQTIILVTLCAVGSFLIGGTVYWVWQLSQPSSDPFSPYAALPVGAAVLSGAPTPLALPSHHTNGLPYNPRSVYIVALKGEQSEWLEFIPGEMVTQVSELESNDREALVQGIRTGINTIAAKMQIPPIVDFTDTKAIIQLFANYGIYLILWYMGKQSPPMIFGNLSGIAPGMSPGRGVAPAMPNAAMLAAPHHNGDGHHAGFLAHTPGMAPGAIRRAPHGLPPAGLHPHYGSFAGERAAGTGMLSAAPGAVASAPGVAGVPPGPSLGGVSVFGNAPSMLASPGLPAGELATAQAANPLIPIIDAESMIDRMLCACSYVFPANDAAVAQQMYIGKMRDANELYENRIKEFLHLAARVFTSYPTWTIKGKLMAMTMPQPKPPIVMTLPAPQP